MKQRIMFFAVGALTCSVFFSSCENRECVCVVTEDKYWSDDYKHSEKTKKYSYLDEEECKKKSGRRETSYGNMDGYFVETTSCHME